MTKLVDRVINDSKVENGKVTKQSASEKFESAETLEGTNESIKTFIDLATSNFNARTQEIAKEEFFASARKAIKANVITANDIRRAFNRTNHFSISYTEERKEYNEKGELIEKSKDESYILTANYTTAKWYKKNVELLRPSDYWNCITSFARFEKATILDAKKKKKQVDEYLQRARTAAESMLSFNMPAKVISEAISKDEKYSFVTPEIILMWDDGEDYSTLKWIEILGIK